MSEWEKCLLLKIDLLLLLKVLELSKCVLKEKQVLLFVDMVVEGILLLLLLFDLVEVKQKSYLFELLEVMLCLLEIKLKEFGVEVSVDLVYLGFVIICFEIQFVVGVKVSCIFNLVKDLVCLLVVISVWVVEVIFGKIIVGIEIFNEDWQMVCFFEVLLLLEYDEYKFIVLLVLGYDIGGWLIIIDLVKMLYLLVVGIIGFGKLVGVNVMFLLILFKFMLSEV